PRVRFSSSKRSWRTSQRGARRHGQQQNFTTAESSVRIRTVAFPNDSPAGPRRCQRSARGPPLFADHRSSPDARVLPRAIVTLADADAALAEPDHFRSVPFGDDTAGGREAEAVRQSPHLDGQDTVDCVEHALLADARGPTSSALSLLAIVAALRAGRCGGVFE